MNQPLRRFRMWWGWGVDPGPCPICGAPHTMCTGPTGNVLAVPVRRRYLWAKPTPPPEPPAPPVTFTTATYERAKHNPLTKRRRREG